MKLESLIFLHSLVSLPGITSPAETRAVVQNSNSNPNPNPTPIQKSKAMIYTANVKASFPGHMRTSSSEMLSVCNP